MNGKFTEEQKEWLREYIPGHWNEETAAAFRKRFKTDWVTYKTIRNFSKNNHIRTGMDAKFKKGHPSRNKDCKIPPEIREKIAPYLFKKGNTPHNMLPVGTEIITSDGYVKVKIEYPRKWKFKHRMVYEEHYGPIPKDCVIRFLDGDKTNCSIDNLICVNKTVNQIINRNNLFVSQDKDINKTAVAIAKLIVAKDAAERSKENGHEGF